MAAADDDRLLNLVGELHMALGRGRAAGCDRADLLSGLGQFLGEAIAELQLSVPVTVVLAEISIQARDAHRARKGRIERLEAAREHPPQRLPLEPGS